MNIPLTQTSNAIIGRLLHADTMWLESTEGRHLVAKCITLVHRQHGRHEAKRLRNYLTYLGLWPCCAWLNGETESR